MAGPVYKFFQSTVTEAWYQLSEKEQNEHTARCREALKQVGGKAVLECTPVWSNEKWLICGVEEFPDIDAVQNYAALLHQLQHFRYYKGNSTLAVKWPPS